jgi:hypothetical protein
MARLAGDRCVRPDFRWAFLSWLLPEKYRRVTSIRNWRNASLAISPEGLAMVQGEMKGELRWDEVQSVRANKKPLGGFRLSSATPGPAIVLKVQGATIHIADIYESSASANP